MRPLAPTAHNPAPAACGEALQNLGTQVVKTPYWFATDFRHSEESGELGNAGLVSACVHSGSHVLTGGTLLPPSPLGCPSTEAAQPTLGAQP